MRQETRWTPLSSHHWLTDELRGLPCYELGKELLPEGRQRNCECQGHQQLELTKQITIERVLHQRVLEACQGPWSNPYLTWRLEEAKKTRRVRDVILRLPTGRFSYQLLLSTRHDPHSTRRNTHRNYAIERAQNWTCSSVPVSPGNTWPRRIKLFPCNLSMSPDRPWGVSQGS